MSHHTRQLRQVSCFCNQLIRHKSRSHQLRQSDTVTTITYLQPATRGELSRLVGKEVSRDIIGRLKSLDLIAAGPRAPEAGAPYAYVTTRKFLEVFGLASLRERRISKVSKTLACCNGPRT
jgi:chromosome segregation and condensation protein ScpB